MPDAMRRVCRGQGQADIPAEQPAPGPSARLSVADAHSRRPCDCYRAAPQGSTLAHCLSKGGEAVLPERYRMRRSADFGSTVRYGRRAALPDVVIHSRRTDPAAGEAAVPAGPKVGLIVAKSVGTAVQRHRVARRLRHVMCGALDELTAGEQMVIRALPGSSTASSAQLERQLRTGLRRVHRDADR